MNANTVILNTNEYNSLRDFKHYVELGHSVRIYNVNGYYKTYISKEDSVAEIAIVNNKLQNKILELQTTIEELKIESLKAQLNSKKNSRFRWGLLSKRI